MSERRHRRMIRWAQPALVVGAPAALLFAACEEPSQPPAPKVGLELSPGDASSASSAHPTSSAQPIAPVASAPPSGSEPEPAPAAAAGAMFERGRVASALSALEEKVAENGKKLLVLDVAVFPEKLRVQVQDPKKGDGVVNYEIRDGTLSPPRPVGVTGGSLAPAFFRLDEPAWDALPDMVDKALAEHADLSQGRVDYVNLARDLPFSRRLIFRVFVKAGDETAYADFDQKGRLLKADKGTPR